MCFCSIHLPGIRLTFQDGAGPNRLVHHVARDNMEDQADCEPVFVTTRALPSRHVSLDTIDLCSAAERTTGRGTIRGAQRIRGLWRIYRRKSEARQKLLLEGMELWGVQISVVDKNPFIIRDQNDEDKKPATKVWVPNVRISFEDKQIETALTKIGCELRSALRKRKKKELARNKDRQLNWETGRRFVRLTTPKTRLQKDLKIGIFNAEIYDKEQKALREGAKKCTNCLLPGHGGFECKNSVVCLACHRPGHRRGDTLCELTPQQTERGPV